MDGQCRVISPAHIPEVILSIGPLLHSMICDVACVENESSFQG